LEKRMGRAAEEDFTPAGAMMLDIRGRHMRKDGHVSPPDADRAAFVCLDDEIFTADDADVLSRALHRLAVNARALNRGRFS
jgi:hypothetical protein